ncbi:kinase-like domain-containing protein [Cantharellus anzutake]|uniref:kinase-like domain-containing protein n=1 Tax=Cantharellus anzutake TaxID=1750568 RepID=UPI0019073F27|nr:kinase-like domain-containing protein [Cantharellus anzutake]KAF8323513.1 kinase-like domain-containing protein [Cantharellus anzutake]
MVRDKEHLSIVLEYVENGSLGQTLRAFGKLNERLVASYVVKILEGLHYLHTSKVVHCDLKAANILTTKNGNVKLSDFGVSLNLHAMENTRNDAAGTPNWMSVVAPEVIELKGASPASDIWSLGCTIIELITGKPPYAEIQNGLSVMFRIVEDRSPQPPPGCSDDLKDFLQRCFDKDPHRRPDAVNLFEHPWLKSSWGEHKVRHFFRMNKSPEHPPGVATPRQSAISQARKRGCSARLFSTSETIPLK